MSNRRDLQASGRDLGALLMKQGLARARHVCSRPQSDTREPCELIRRGSEANAYLAPECVSPVK